METDYKYIGKRISSRRRELGLKQSEVEEKAGIGYKYLSNIERGISIPSLEVILRLSDALDTTPDYFLICSDKNINNTELAVKLIRSLDNDKLMISLSFLRWLKDTEI